MRHVYFCNPDKSKEILSKIQPSYEYEASVFEDRVDINFNLPIEETHDESIDFYIHESAPGDPTYNRIKFGFFDVTIYGFYDAHIIEIAKSLNLKEDYIRKLNSVFSYSCPLEVVDTINHEQEKAMCELIGKNEGSDDDW